nr:unnamed protein product [Spirometra erinaceieuropaei]
MRVDVLPLESPGKPCLSERSHPPKPECVVSCAPDYRSACGKRSRWFFMKSGRGHSHPLNGRLICAFITFLAVPRRRFLLQAKSPALNHVFTPPTVLSC